MKLCTRTEFRHLLIVLSLALFVRWTYSVVLFLAMGDAGLMGVDSYSYVETGRSFAHSVPAFQNFQLLGSNTNVMPLATWLLALAAYIGGDNMALAYVLMQGLFDTGTCLFVYAIANLIDPRIAFPSALFSAVNPTQIVLSGLVYVDTPFTFFIAMFLFGALRWQRSPSPPSIAIMIIGLAGAALIRVLVAPFVFVLPFFLFLFIEAKYRFAWKTWFQLLAIPTIFALFMAPIYLRNESLYGSRSLTSQSGMHLALWVVPLVWEAHNGTPWERGYQEMQRRATELGALQGQNQFEQSKRYQEVATQELIRLGIIPVIKAWGIGAAINLASPAALISPPVSHLPRTGFYATPGTSPLEKIGNFIFRSDNTTYAWILLGGVVGIFALRLIQLLGALTLLRDRTHWPTLCLFGIWISYILAVNGPIASPKYRLPLEVPLCVLAGAGCCSSTIKRRRT